MKRTILFGVFALFVMYQQMALGQSGSPYDFPKSAPSFAMRANTIAASQSVAVACFETTRTTYATDINPQGVDAGDLDNDGDIDLVTGNAVTNNVSVFMNQGDGTFAAKVDYEAATGTFSITIADLNGDGFKDIVAASSNGGGVKVLLNSGTGTFTAGVSLAFADPRESKVGDVNADGKPDLVITTGDSVSVLLGNGDGTFAAAVTYTIGNQAVGLVLKDFDADGDLDIATANFGSTTISVLLGAGDGTFGTHVTYPVNSQPQGLVSGDFDGDGDFDLATNNFGSNNVSVLLGNGDGTFAAKTDYAVGAAPRFTGLGDVNADGKLDLAVSNRDSYTYSLRLGNGDGTFAADCQIATSDLPRAIVVADLNGDGVDDVATTQFNAKTIDIHLSVPKIVVTTTAATSITGTSATLNGTINPKGNVIGSATFRYGTDPTLATFSTATVNVWGIGTGSTPVPVSASLTGLTSNTTYYFQLTALLEICPVVLGPASCSEMKAVTGNVVGSNLKTRDRNKSLAMIDPSVKGAILSFNTTVSVPTAINLSNSSFGEFSPVGTLIGTLSTTDLDIGDTFTYTLIAGECGTDNALVKIVGNQLQVNQANLSYNQKQTLNIQIRTTDSFGNSLIQCKMIQVQNVNFAPVFLSQAVAEGQDCSPFKHAIYVADRDAEDTFTVSLVDAPSWVQLTVNGASVQLTGLPLQAQVGTYTFKVRVKSGNDTVDQAMTVKIADVNHAPVFTSIMPNLGTVLHKGNKFVADFSATDCDGDLLTLKPMGDLPTWITASSTNKIEATKGPVSASFMGNATELGAHALTVVASDGKLDAKQAFHLHVTERFVPLVSSTPPESIDFGKEFSYELKSSSEDGHPVMFLVMSAPSWATFTCDGSATTPTGGTQDRCVGSKKSVLSGTPKAEDLPANFKIMILDDIIYNPSRSCQEFTLARDGAKVVVKDFKRTNCGTEVLANAEKETPQITKTLAEIPSEFALLGNYPNPFNPSSAVVFNLPESAQVMLQVYNVTGQLVKLIPSQSYSAGANQRVELNMSDLGSGLYIYRLTANGTKNTFSATGRMTLVK